jgi:hypothetical protein
MSEYKIYSRGTLVGTTMLEYGDPPMGVAFGRLIPTEAYATIKATCVANHHDQSDLQLSAEKPRGEVIQCAGVGILEGGGDIEVNVLGISAPSYAELFPHHVAQYEGSLK